MTLYFYQATDKSGKLVEGSIDAADQKTAVQRIRGLNYFPIQVSDHRRRQGFSLNLKGLDLDFLPKVSQKELMTMTQQLAALVSSGLTLDKGLSILVKLTEKKGFREILADVQNRVHGGNTFADALSHHPKIFSRLYINMIRAGEAGGVLGAVLLRLSDFLEKSEELKNNVRSALVYPTLLTLVGGAAVAVLMTLVIPKFAAIFGDMGVTLPLPTQFLLKTSDIVSGFWWLFILLAAGAAIGFKTYMKNDAGKYQWDGFVLKLPLFGSLIRKIEVSRFSRTMSTLLQSGVPILQSLFIVRSILDNSVIGAAMENLHKGLKGGKGISAPLQKLQVFPAMATHMITVGEETGMLEEMLAKISDIYDKEVERSIKNLISLIEPLMILFMGAVVGFIVISMLMAIFSINEIPL
jgi:general secretion pathway protein F